MKFYVFNACSDKVSVNYSLSLGLLNTEYKPSVKKRSTGQSTGVDFEFYRSGRVKKILTGSISDVHSFLFLLFTIPIFSVKTEHLRT